MKNFELMKKLVLSSFLLVAALPQLTWAQTSSAKVERNAPWSVRMADSEMIRNPDAAYLDFNTAPKWNYTNGLVCSAIQHVWNRTKDQKYYNYIKAYADQMINEDGAIKTYKPEEYNIDKVNSGKFLFGLYEQTKDQKYEKAIRLLRDQMRTHPRTSEGGFWHKKIYPHQMWLDGLYMGSPFLTQYAGAYNERALLDEVALQVRLIEKYTYDENIGLYYHAWDESKEQKWADKKTGRSPHVWGRAMGWYAMALVDILDYFPKDHSAYKEILAATQRMAKAVSRYQDVSGVWYQVVNMGAREGNYLEASASSMFTYFLIKAIKKGYIGNQYLANAWKGYDGILNRFIKVDDKSMVNITQVCAVAGLGGNPYRDGSYEYYINEMKRDNDPKAVGPFIMMALEFEELDKKNK
jgi:unsaturated rhamnogalacturonyl hydrolase